MTAIATTKLAIALTLGAMCAVVLAIGAVCVVAMILEAFDK